MRHDQQDSVDDTMHGRAEATGPKTPNTSSGQTEQSRTPRQAKQNKVGHLVRPNRTKSLFEARRLSAGSTVMVGAAPSDVFHECGQAGKGMTPTALLVHTATSSGPTVAELPTCTAT